jgi:cytoskeletal protein CcmA (bactofilin family)
METADMAYNRRIKFIFLIAIVTLISLCPAFLRASEFISKKTITIPREQIVEDDLYLFSNYSKIYGRVIGDLTAFGYDINAVGEIDGNVNLAGFRSDFYGTASKSVRQLGYYINTGGEIDGNLIAIGNTISIDEKAVIGKDITCYGEEITVDGNVGGSAKLTGKTVIISGNIDGDVEIKADKILIVPPAHIKGNLKYFSPKVATIENGAIVDGEDTWKMQTGTDSEDGPISVLSVSIKVFLFLMVFLTGLIIIAFFRDHTSESSLQIEKNFWIVLASGFLAMICFTIGALILILLLIGIPLGILLIFLGIALFYLGKIYVSIALGRLLFKWTHHANPVAIGWELLLGLIVLTLLFQIPLLGWIIYLLTAIIGSGAAIHGFLSLREKCRSLTASSGNTNIL